MDGGYDPPNMERDHASMVDTDYRLTMRLDHSGDRRRKAAADVNCGCRATYNRYLTSRRAPPSRQYRKLSVLSAEQLLNAHLPSSCCMTCRDVSYLPTGFSGRFGNLMWHKTTVPHVRSVVEQPFLHHSLSILELCSTELLTSHIQHKWPP